MNQLPRLTAFLVLTVGITGCLSDPTSPLTALPRNLSVAERDLIEADNRFALKLFRAINAQQPDSNVFISPLSIAMVLGMAYNGAGGETQDAMARTLEVSELSAPQVNEAYRNLIELLLDLDSRVDVRLANSLWHRDTMSFEQAFLDTNREYFNAEISGLDFDDPATPQLIDDWVYEATGGRIEKIAPDPIDPYLVMLLINATYFKADWTEEFAKDRTRPSPFMLLDGSEKDVPTMGHGSTVELKYFSADRMEVGDIPYGRQAFSMTVLVPREGPDVNALIDDLDNGVWQTVTANLEDTRMDVMMPKFTMEYEIDLKNVLTELGMGVAFDRQTADFSNIRKQHDLFLDFVKHKTFVRVDEEGTEAAAATSGGLTVQSGPPTFYVDRPFVFVIRERLSGTILFIGKIVDPEPQS